MTDTELIKSLRLCSTSSDSLNCSGRKCLFFDKWGWECVEALTGAAADRLEELLKETMNEKIYIETTKD